jgi:predicted RNase H-like HicB family nuclease
MASSFELTAVFEPVEDGWIQARIAEIPGVITAAPDMESAKEMLADALREYVLALGEVEAEPPNGSTTTGQRFAVTLDL